MQGNALWNSKSEREAAPSRAPPLFLPAEEIPLLPYFLFIHLPAPTQHRRIIRLDFLPRIGFVQFQQLPVEFQKAEEAPSFRNKPLGQPVDFGEVLRSVGFVAIQCEDGPGQVLVENGVGRPVPFGVRAVGPAGAVWKEVRILGFKEHYNQSNNLN